MAETTTHENHYVAKDFKSDQEVRWCPGCGDHGILASLQKALAELDIPKEKYVFVSGIGCSSRLPYYMNTYGFHGIHGRAAPIATGIKIANPDLMVWMMTGDGDALAIGGNHFIHAIRRNIDIKIILFNNEIYGLTKGQYSPTSKKGLVTKTSPYGTIEESFKIGELTIGASGRFFARTVDYNLQLSNEVYKQAALFNGTAMVEVIQNCVIFNDGAHDLITNKETRDDNTLVLRHGEPMIFGKNRDKGLILENLKLKVIKFGENGYTEKDVLVHDAHEPNPGIHYRLAGMHLPDYPVSLGVIRSIKDHTYDEAMRDQHVKVQEASKIKSVDELLRSGATWKK
ncbi:MAG: 2-oxoacid:ferredoxin oxidoreductase subunit beta [Bacteroidales bacterium]|nr:2-oxoacid:ferredoxin oxidoreductase subunit beta [Bacteroidales bacterium]MDT8374010.1 2-oxoacid:ferredoxin oxidoreductase subunit beta [Bacteroidales bacterium]